MDSMGCRWGAPSPRRTAHRDFPPAPILQGLFFDDSYGFYPGQVLIGPAKIFSSVQWLSGVKPVLSTKSKFRVVVEEVGPGAPPGRKWPALRTEGLGLWSGGDQQASDPQPDPPGPSKVGGSAGPDWWRGGRGDPLGWGCGYRRSLLGGPVGPGRCLEREG